MKTDIEIAQEAKMLPITRIAEKAGILEDELIPYGKYKAKISLDIMSRLASKPNGKLVLVTAVNPTPAGEGKTTTTVGLGQAMAKIGKNAVIALREPSLGPVFGIKGGAAGGGYSQAVPMEDINLHFTGDMHAITAANNLLCAVIDNHIHQGNSLQIDERRILFKRCMDMNDRALRNVVVGLGGKANGFPVYARELGVVGSMAALLRDALMPNLVQTLENTPAIIHGGPFANIAHGCNSVTATRLALKLGDYCITEAGFGSDLGAEKFLDIKCRAAGLAPSAIVIVATLRALKYNGGVSKNETSKENVAALKKGIVNLGAHVENMKKYGVPVVVAINRFGTDTDAEIEALADYCRSIDVEYSLSECFAKGGDGATDLAQKVVNACEKPSDFHFIYDTSMSIKEKVEAVAKNIYGAQGVNFTSSALKRVQEIEALGKDKLPVCIAKTQYSLSDDPKRLGRPTDFDITVRDVKLSSGAGFIVVLTGDIMTMPGLPKVPAAESIDVDESGNITGLF